MQMHCYLFQSTLDKPCKVHSHLDHVFTISLIWNPWSETRASLSTRAIFTVGRCNNFDIFVEQIMLHRQYLGNPQDILQTIDHGRCQHIVEEVCGVKVVVGASKWTLSSWYGAR